MTARVVNRVTRLREPSRLRHDVRMCGGLVPFVSALLQTYGPLAFFVFEYGYGDYDLDRWRIPDDPFDASTWTDPETRDDSTAAWTLDAYTEPRR
ncbi:hypothetical protein SEA_PHLOP_3 [Gordonia phage Phlop]|uniref:Uncharacterized protein n=12 Tax=Wizardvirus TaxID=2169658 RepID=A0A4Y5TZC0_9CAUD|nr:hypothetical protein BH794_gp03 [Gordonia phage Wizard]YP_010096608.1 hypothetical protein KNT95_gp03 [Gordonia phage Danyall]YP_010096703.1 hypothetical protein KNT96_gp03 [Gordonia phage KimmyK]YP_010100805.1 hypothetical protein KNU39_gp03 [Gordonia phage Mutzi]YP_010102156.1 hypothetical protein KNU55_gp03 [Gordonia phage Barb]YP_010102254.1 hypothetical protein KNU56_gp03 [Gordonia phage Arri]YP_010102348.1 hypothetical protein KNU57_gp03 [Gordonia phage Valary]YP_010103013.1 hypothe